MSIASSTIDNIWAVVPAAGIGQRMQLTQPKQYLNIAGKAVLQHSLHALLSVPSVQHAVVALANNDTQWAQLPASSDNRVSTVVGGEQRADSVIAGLLAVIEQTSDATWVLVHDAARPLVAADDIIRLIDRVATGQFAGGLLASPLQDTLKLAADEQTLEIKQTVDRRLLWLAQTPQLFRAGELLAAYQAQLGSSDVQITDEASVMELAGYTPVLVEALQANFKITRNSDVKLAEVLLLDRLSSI